MMTANAVKSILARFGSTGTLRTIRLTYDGSSGLPADPVVVLTAFTAVQSTNRREFANTAVPIVGELTLYMSCKVTPAVGDEVVWQGTKYSVKIVRTTAPNGRDKLMYLVNMVAAE